MRPLGCRATSHQFFRASIWTLATAASEWCLTLALPLHALGAAGMALASCMVRLEC